MKYIFFTDCVNANGYEIQDMVDKAKEVTAKTFFKKYLQRKCCQMFSKLLLGERR